MATHLEGLRDMYGLHVAIPNPNKHEIYLDSLDYRKVRLRKEFQKRQASVRTKSNISRKINS